MQGFIYLFILHITIYDRGDEPSDRGEGRGALNALQQLYKIDGERAATVV